MFIPSRPGLPPRLRSALSEETLLLLERAEAVLWDSRVIIQRSRALRESGPPRLAGDDGGRVDR
jgi:hypothetical protein